MTHGFFFLFLNPSTMYIRGGYGERAGYSERQGSRLGCWYSKDHHPYSYYPCQPNPLIAFVICLIPGTGETEDVMRLVRLSSTQSLKDENTANVTKICIVLQLCIVLKKPLHACTFLLREIANWSNSKQHMNEVIISIGTLVSLQGWLIEYREYIHYILAKYSFCRLLTKSLSWASRYQ